jgi:excisionase family DNA binding protein
MKATAAEGEVLTTKEVCHLLRIHPSTLYKLTKQGRIPGFRIGNDWRFRTELIERWMAEKSVYARLARNFIESGVN